MWTKRGKACLILIFSTNTNCESMAYRSFRSEEYSARGVRKVTTGMTNAALDRAAPVGISCEAIITVVMTLNPSPDPTQSYNGHHYRDYGFCHPRKSRSPL